MLYSAFRGPRDHSAADIARLISTDGGNTWSFPSVVFRAPAGVLNFSSVSLLRLRDGRIGCVFCVKHSLSELEPVWTVSADEGETWSEPVPLMGEKGYFLVNNDRLIQMGDGTLVVPYALHQNFHGQEQYAHFNPGLNAVCGLIFSVDGGVRWMRSLCQITHTEEYHCRPLFVDEALLSAGVRFQLQHRLGVFQEPGVQELSDGRLMLSMRSSHGIYRAFSDGVNSPWEGCGRMEGLHVCLGPQTIKRLPDSKELLMLYNDRGTIPVGDPRFTLRTPLSLARSIDDARSWRPCGSLTDDSRNYCYFSLLFFQNRFVISCYRSAQVRAPEGLEARRNLASLQVLFGPVSLLPG